MGRRKEIKKLINKALDQSELYTDAEIIYMKKQLQFLKEEKDRKRKEKGFGNG
jgi:hypothetical protein